MEEPFYSCTHARTADDSGAAHVHSPDCREIRRYKRKTHLFWKKKIKIVNIETSKLDSIKSNKPANFIVKLQNKFIHIRPRDIYLTLWSMYLSPVSIAAYYFLIIVAGFARVTYCTRERISRYRWGLKENSIRNLDMVNFLFLSKIGHKHKIRKKNTKTVLIYTFISRAGLLALGFEGSPYLS